MRFGKVTHCIFDLDGTIFDTEKIYYESVDAILQQFGKSHSPNLCRKILGRTRPEYAKIIVEETKLPLNPEQFLELLDMNTILALLNSSLLPGVKKLICHLHKHGIPMAIATGGTSTSVSRKFTLHGDLDSHFHHIVSATDDAEVHEGKPAPDVFLVAAKRFDPAPEPEHCLVFEDSPNGVRAAVAAGMQVVMIPDFKIVTHKEKKEATICLNSMQDFRPEAFGLPPFEGQKLKRMKPVTHCVFDVDAVFDADQVHFKAFEEVLRTFGIPNTPQMYQRTIGKTRAEYAKIIVKAACLPITPDEFLRRMDVISNLMFPHISLAPGAKKLILHLHKHGIPMAVKTNGSLTALDLKFTRYQDLKSRFHHILSEMDDSFLIGNNDACEVFYVTSERFDPAPEPEKCVAFETSLSKVRPAVMTGMQVVLVPNLEIASEESRWKPTICLDSLASFKPQMFGLPAYEDDKKADSRSQNGSSTSKGRRKVRPPTSEADLAPET